MAPALAGTVTVGLGGAAGLLGVLGISGHGGGVRLGWLLPLAGVDFAVSATAGLFMLLVGLVAVAAGVYSIGYFRTSGASTITLAVAPVFTAAMLGVLAAGSVVTLLVCWEMMALASLVGVLSDHHRPAALDAGRWYAGMTQLGFVAILVGLVVLSASGGSGDMVLLGRHAGRLTPTARNAVFALTALGFGSKAGLVPLHVWLPRAHPEAPGPVSALMSAAMVAVGIYGLVRVDVQILGPGPRWWAVAVLGFGALSAVYGVLQASVSTDLKRLLAYSTTENMGVVAVGVGAGMLLIDYHRPGAAAVAIAAALVHTVAHAVFKALLFLSAGAAVAATGIRDLDRLGGLAVRMPATTILFAVGALGASGLPLGAGFVSEWLLLQALIHTEPGSGTLLAVVMPVAVGVVALSTGLGVAAMVKAFGVGFLARPRSPEAAEAREASPSMVAGMSFAAAACGVAAVAPVVLSAALDKVLGETPGVGLSAAPSLGVVLRLPGLAGSVSPAVLAAAVVSVTLAVVVLAGRAGARRRPAAVTAPLWTCGAGPLSERMEYTATSFAQPLQQVFDVVLRPEVDVEVSHAGGSEYLVERVRFRSRVDDTVELRLYRPILAAVSRWAGWVRRAHPGSVHLYIGYGAIGVTVVLVVAR
ncbi:proton-conducting transporter membrane subunit [Acidiferrimicrobium sp. IK]|uniref:proton-conducting transporter transmembrane domain-containing protein n=1 Tax=Acidiferrimicrobium sp. IK TaxID=2871700 RepID=UPI0039674BDF